METIKCRSVNNNNRSSRIARTFQKVINLKNSTKHGANNGIGVCILTSKFDGDGSTNPDHHHQKKAVIAKRRAILEALAAKLFASVTTIKAAYAELQMAQNPYFSDAIQAADQGVVDELKNLSELKRSFFKNDLDHLSPQVTVMLAEIQEQQSMMKTYEITIKKLEAEAEAKESKIRSFKKQLDECVAFNKSVEKTLNASGPLTMFDTIQFPVLNITHFAHFLQFGLRSMRSFVKQMVREMESARWDIDAAAKAIEPDTNFTKPNHKVFAFESFVSKTMFEGFDSPNFSSSSSTQSQKTHDSEQYFNKFKKIKSLNTKQFLTQNPNSSFARFTRSKYLQLIHCKMECSLFGNLNQRKAVNSGGVPDSGFFTAFLEMARRVWCLHLLAFSFEQEVGIFQARKNSRFSEVYMEAVSQDSLMESSCSSSSHSSCVGTDHLQVAFTVVPGFKIGKKCDTESGVSVAGGQNSGALMIVVLSFFFLYNL